MHKLTMTLNILKEHILRTFSARDLYHNLHTLRLLVLCVGPHKTNSLSQHVKKQEIKNGYKNICQVQLITK